MPSSPTGMLALLADDKISKKVPGRGSKRERSHPSLLREAARICHPFANS